MEWLPDPTDKNTMAEHYKYLYADETPYCCPCVIQTRVRTRKFPNGKWKWAVPGDEGVKMIYDKRVYVMPKLKTKPDSLKEIKYSISKANARGYTVTRADYLWVKNVRNLKYRPAVRRAHVVRKSYELHGYFNDEWYKKKDDRAMMHLLTHCMPGFGDDDQDQRGSDLLGRDEVLPGLFN